MTRRRRVPRSRAWAAARSSSGACCIISFSLFLYSFGYGGITSFTALYADANGVTPKSIYLTALAIVILLTRPMAGRLGDRFGYKRVFVPCLVLICSGWRLLSFGGTRGWLIASAVVFGVGFGTAYPVYVGYVMQGVDADRRGAAFGAILAAFDTGIGTGSTSMGYLIQHYGFASAFGIAAGSVRAGPAVLPDRRPPGARAGEGEPARRHRRMRLGEDGGNGITTEERSNGGEWIVVLVGTCA